MFRPCLALLSALLLALPAAGGDPLPPGGVRRFSVVTPLPTRAADRQAEEMRSVKEVCLEGDGKTVVTWKGDGTVQVWQLATGEVLNQWQHNRELTWAASPDGKVMAVVGKDEPFALFAADTGKQVRRFRNPLPSNLGSLFFSADAKTLIARHFSPPRISRWDVATGRMLDCAPCDNNVQEASAASADGKVLALGSLEGRLSIWDQGARKLRCQRDGYSQVWGLAFSADGSRLASVCGGNTIWLWDTKTYQPLRRLSWRGPRASFAVFSPDGKLLASHSSREVILWEAATGKVRRTFSGHQGDVTSAAFTPDGKRLLTGSRDGTVLVWDLTAPPPAPAATVVHRDRHGDPLPAAARARLGCVRLHMASLFLDCTKKHLDFSPDGKRLFVGVLSPEEESPAGLDLHPSDSSPGVRVLEVPTGKEGPRLEDVPQGVECLTCSPDGETLAALFGPTLYLWNTSTGKLKRMAHDDLHGPDPYEPRFLTYSPDGRLLAAATEEQIELLDGGTGRCIRKLRGVMPGVAALAFSSDGKRLISCSGPRQRQNARDETVVDPGAVVSWDVGTGKSVRRMALPADVHPTAFYLSPGGIFLASFPGNDGVRLWDIPGGRELPSIPVEGNTLDFSPDSKLLAVGGPELHLWDLAAGKEVLSVPCTEPSIWLMRFAPDGKRLVTREGTRLHFYDLDKGREIVTHEGHRGGIAALACAARGNFLLSGGADRTLRLWDTTTNRVVRELHGHDSVVTTLALSPDGRLAASQDSAGQVFLWDVAGGRRLQQGVMAAVDFRSQRFGLPQTVAFADGGKVLLLADGAGRVQLRQVSSWQVLHSFQGGKPPIWPPALSADGKLLALPVSSPGQGALLRLLEMSTGAERWCIHHGDGEGQYQGMTFSPDGGVLAVSRAVVPVSLGNREHSQRIVLLECTTGKEILALEARFTAAVLAFSPDGKVLAVARPYGQVPTLWDVRTGKLLAEVSGDKDWVTALAFSADGRTLFSASFDGTILAWDMDRLTQRQPQRPRDLTPHRLRQAWDDLAAADASRAWKAIADLSAVPAKTLPFLQAHLRPIGTEDPRRIARFIANLDSDDFAVREEATRRLAETVDQAELALRQALRKQPTVETSRRLERVLRYLHTSPEQQRAWRVCLLLDWLDSTEADKLLRKMAGGAADARLAREARAALERRARRQSLDHPRSRRTRLHGG